MAEVDYDALASKFGGRDASAPVDYDAIASKYGGKDATKTTKKMGAVEDVLRTAPGIIPRAAGNLVGFPQLLADLVDKGMMKLYEKAGPSKTLDALDRMFGFDPNDKRQVQDILGVPRLGQVVEHGWDEISKLATGKPFHKPETGAGRIVDTTGQAMVSGPGSMLQKGVIGASSAVSGEAARLVTENPIAIGVAQLLGGTAASLPFILRSVPAENINAAIKDIKPDDLVKAQKLMDDARKMGAPITGSEAIAQVTGKNTLQDIQRVVEGSKESAGIMQPMMNARPEANRAAFTAQGDKIANNAYINPAETPVKLQEAASASIKQARQAGNAAAKPSYDAAASQSIPASEWNTLAQDPAVQKALNAVKGDAMWGVANEPPGSIRLLDAAKRWIDDELVGSKPAVARILQDANSKIKAAADAASPDYAAARSIVADNRQNVVRPLENSPVGDIARTGASPGMPRPSGENMMKEQAGILMPSSPRALDPKTITSTVETLSKHDPDAARRWVRQNLEAAFNEATQNTVGGANQWGGAKFASQIAGNPAQKENLQALVEATGGKRAWAGFERMMDVMEAQGKRLAPGSNTARDFRTAESLSSAGMGGAPAVATAGLNIGNVIYSWYQNFRFGKNTAEMAKILTDPKSVDMMRELARYHPSDAKASALVSQIVSGSAGAQQRTEDRSASDTQP